MKRALMVMGMALAIFVAMALITATPLVGEVVTLQTRNAEGEWQSTPLWIVDFDDASYLRAGDPQSAWVTRLRAHPEVRLERADEVDDVRLVEEPSKLQAVHDEMAAKYGWADDFVALMSADRSKSVALRIAVVGESAGP